MSLSDPQFVGPYEQLHRRLDSLQMRFVRDMTANPWRTENLIFEDWNLQGPEYETEVIGDGHVGEHGEADR